MDSVWGGINDWLASALEVDNKKPSVKLINSNPATDSLGGLGRIAELHEPLPLSKLQELIRSHLKLSQGALQVAYGSTEGSERLIKTVAMCAGGGASVLKGVDADLYWTGEMAHVRVSSISLPVCHSLTPSQHDVLAAVAAGRDVILCGHTNTERGYLPTLASKLTATLKEDNIATSMGTEPIVNVSQSDRHPLDFV
jgi:putative NIF3 family GTP cyclohydrolase 1 type 2